MLKLAHFGHSLHTIYFYAIFSKVTTLEYMLLHNFNLNVAIANILLWYLVSANFLGWNIKIKVYAGPKKWGPHRVGSSKFLLILEPQLVSLTPKLASPSRCLLSWSGLLWQNFPGLIILSLCIINFRIMRAFFTFGWQVTCLGFFITSRKK